MTDGPVAGDPELAERLAKLRARRSRDVTPSSRGPELEAEAAPAASTSRQRRRRSPAATAKIVTVGASTTAVLGLLAGYGYAEQRPEGPELVDAGIAPNADDGVDPTVGAATAMAPAAPTTPTTGHVVVVLVDRSSGEQLASVTGATRDEAVAGAMEVVGSLEPIAGDPAPLVVPTPVDTTAAVPAATVPVPVPQPTAIDLAVPVPPRPSAPTPAPSVAAAPAPAPVPEASSGGS